MEAGVFEEIRVYITRRRNTVAQYIVTRPILNLCEQSFWRPVAWLSWRWWEKEVLHIYRGRRRERRRIRTYRRRNVERKRHRRRRRAENEGGEYTVKIYIVT